MEDPEDRLNAEMAGAADDEHDEHPSRALVAPAQEPAIARGGATVERDSEREILRRARKAVRHHTERLMPYNTLFELTFAMSGAIDGILWGWCLEVMGLHRALSELSEQVVNEELSPAAALAQARQLVERAVRSLRPNVRVLPAMGPVTPPGAMAELGQYIATASHLAEELMELYREAGWGDIEPPALRVIVR
jgi:hypothetical protein